MNIEENVKKAQRKKRGKIREEEARGKEAAARMGYRQTVAMKAGGYMFCVDVILSFPENKRKRGRETVSFEDFGRWTLQSLKRLLLSCYNATNHGEDTHEP